MVIYVQEPLSEDSSGQNCLATNCDLRSLLAVFCSLGIGLDISRGPNNSVGNIAYDPYLSRISQFQ